MIDNRNAKARAKTWMPAGVSPWRKASPWSAWAEARADAFNASLRRWAAMEVGPGRLVIWLPVAFGLGIVLYFSAEREPLWWAGPSFVFAASLVAFLLRSRPAGFPLAMAVAMIAAGFSAASLKSQRAAGPILQAPLYATALAGFVLIREEREKSDRIVVAVDRLEAARIETRPTRVRLSVRKGRAPPAGTYILMRARLMPPMQPLRPGGYDFARDLYFQGIGTTGFALGAIQVVDPPRPPELGLRMTAQINAMRDAIDARIRSVVSGDPGAIASALITGKRDAISSTVSEAMYVSSLAHVLSISGYHMAVVAGVVFFAFRATLALFPALASRRAIKKWAAAAALCAATFYLFLSGAEVATRRAYIMTTIVLIGVMLDRPALTLRTIAVAALALLALAPEALVHPSFQMSFAATLALIAAYERGLPWLVPAREGRVAMRIALWGGREILALVIASVVAGLATTLYAAYHFHRLAPYGLLSNLLAMPVVSVWVMPSGLLALAAAPFGFDAPLWRLMGEGVGLMTDIALWVSRLPGAVGRIAAFGAAPLLFGTAGIIVLCLLRSPLRFAGVILISAGCVLAAFTPQPDILVSRDGRAVAVRNATGTLSIMKTARDDFVVRNWLAADADGRATDDPGLEEGVRCDRMGCLAPLRDGTLVALATTPEALSEDCERAAIVISPHRARLASCRARLIDRNELQGSGAMAIRFDHGPVEIVRSRPIGQDRPWGRNLASERMLAVSTRRTELQDATPRPEDLEADDR